jgi:hypothetical protein
MTGPTISYQVNFRQRAGSRVVAPPEPTKVAAETPQQSEPPAHPTARLLAMAHHVERLVATGRLKDYREAAATLGIGHAHMTNVTSLLQLAPDIQEDILAGRLDITEGRLRSICRLPVWEKQREAMSALRDAK